MKIALVGIGTGAPADWTQAASLAVQQAEVLFGASRMLQAAADFHKQSVADYRPAAIAAWLSSHEVTAAAVLLSGDPSFYSGGAALLEALSALPDTTIEVIPGISSVQMLAARLQKPWQQVHLASLHGRETPVLPTVLTHRRTLFLTDRDHTPAAICQELCAYGCGDFEVAVGENLGYPDETITQKPAQALCGYTAAPLSVVWIENPIFTEKRLCGGWSDEAFLRGSTPMTKREVRAMILSLLDLQAEDRCYWDIGAGTGSVSMELSAVSQKLVYAVEQDEEALALLAKNRAHLGAHSVRIVAGEATGVIATLPAPDAVFIGGSDGKLPELLAHLKARHQPMRVVISAILPQTVVQAANLLRTFGFSEVSLLQLQVTRSRETPRGDLMLAQNPITLIKGCLYD